MGFSNAAAMRRGRSGESRLAELRTTDDGYISESMVALLLTAERPAVHHRHR
jgi:hypothetical protein